MFRDILRGVVISEAESFLLRFYLGEGEDTLQPRESVSARVQNGPSAVSLFVLPSHVDTTVTLLNQCYNPQVVRFSSFG